jgi:hypothetical protein
VFERLRQRIRESQARAARARNSEHVMLYWSIGRDILAEQRASDWDDFFLSTPKPPRRRFGQSGLNCPGFFGDQGY